MNKIITLFVAVAFIAVVSSKPQPNPNVVAYNVAGVPVVATAPAVTSYATVYEHSYHGNLAPASYVAYSTYDPYVATFPFGASVLLNK